MSEIFQCQGPLNGREIPEACASWDCFARADFIESVIGVEARGEAFVILQEAGEWPAGDRCDAPESEEAAVEASEPQGRELRRLDRRSPRRRRRRSRETAGGSSSSSREYWWQRM